MKYQLTINFNQDTNPEKIASMLEQVAGQVREMSSANAAHSMKISADNAHVIGASVEHGMVHSEPIDAVRWRTSELDGDEIGQQVISTILDRGELTVDQIVKFFETTDEDLYMNYIANAIDQCEDAISEAS